MKITDKYVLFWGSLFSQWYSQTENGKSFQFEDEKGVKYSSCEQYMMYQKSLLFKDFEIADKILKTKDVKVIKNLGRLVKNFDNKIWDENKFSIVKKGNSFKFNQNKTFKATMLKYKNKIFVEASPQDKIWGIGLHYNDVLALDEKNWKGQNLLGKALTETCQELIKS